MDKVNDYSNLEHFDEFLTQVVKRGKFITRYVNEEDSSKVIEIYEYEMIYENYGMGLYDIAIYKDGNKNINYTLKLKI